MSNLISQAYDPEYFRKQGHLLVDRLADYLNDLQQSEPSQKVLNHHSPEELYAYWSTGKGAVDKMDSIAFLDEIIKTTVHMHHPRYMGHQTSNVAPVSALADLAGALLDPGMGVFEQGNAGVVLERVISKKLGMLIGWDGHCDGFLTSGGTLGNLTALLCARQVQLGGDIWERGYEGKKYAFMVSSEAHYSVAKAVKVMGMGDSGVITVPVDDQYRMRTDRLGEYFEKAKRDGIEVIGVVASSCATATGSYDSIDLIADFCEAKKLWLHVDGAHGACVLFSEKYKHLLKGIERADSMIMDYHKMLMVPALVTSVLFKDGNHSFQTFAQKASYLWDKEDSREWYNLGKRTFELTKSNMSIKVYALWKVYGEAIFGKNVELLYDLASNFSELLKMQPDIELALPRPESNIICFRLMKNGWPEEMIEKVNVEVREKLIQEGNFFIVQTRIQGRLFLRMAIMNPFTTEKDLMELLKRLRFLST